jgi:hypothetical protein
VQPMHLAQPGDFAIPEIEAVGLFAVPSQHLEALLYPLPIADAFLFGIVFRRGRENLLSLLGFGFPLFGIGPFPLPSFPWPFPTLSFFPTF